LSKLTLGAKGEFRFPESGLTLILVSRVFPQFVILLVGEFEGEFLQRRQIDTGHRRTRAEGMAEIVESETLSDSRITHGLVVPSVDVVQRSIRITSVRIEKAPLRLCEALLEHLAGCLRHLTGASGDIVVDHATFEALGDDAINMGVVWDTLTKVTSSKSFSMTGPDSAAKPGETLAFFDESLAFLGSARVQSSTGDGTRTVDIENGVNWIRPGIKAMNMSHIPSHFYISDVTVRNKIGRGMLIGGLHGLIQNSTFDSVTMTGILFHFSSYWSEGAPSSDVALRNNQFTGTHVSRKFYQYGTGTGTYPHRNAAISIASEVATNYNKTPDNFNGVYPAFQDIEISGNAIQSLAGAGIYMAGVYNSHTSAGTQGILHDRFTGCASVPHTDPLRPWFGSESTSAVVLNFVDGVSLVRNQTTGHPTCTVREDYSSSNNVSIEPLSIPRKSQVGFSDNRRLQTQVDRSR
jgi:hypothetical protein